MYARRVFRTYAEWTTAPARPSVWAWVGAIGASVVFVAVAFVVIEMLRVSTAMRREASAFGVEWDRALQALDADFARIAMRADTSCSGSTITRVVSASLTSEVARAFFVKPYRETLWCGPVGQRAFRQLEEPQLNEHELALHYEPSIRSLSLRAMVRHGDFVLLAELDPHFLARLETAAAPNLRAWDRDFDVPGGTSIPWLRDSTDVAGRSNPGLPFALITHTTLSPERRVTLTQTMTARHLVRRAADNLRKLLLAATSLATVAMLTLLQQLRDRANPQRRLSMALRKRRFEPFVQPIVEVTTGRCVGGEVLMRWTHPARGTLPPVEFIALAEDSRLIVPMSEIVMTKARDRLARVLERHPKLYFSFNITPAQLRDPQFEDRLAQIFDAESLPRQNLLLELTEREFVDRNAQASLKALSASGYRLAIDDFGTGHSSLATIEQLPLDRIKIDREFVRMIESDTVTRPVLDTIINLAHALEIPMIAEGVETQAQWDYLAARGVQYVQGFLIARPMSTNDFDQWIDEYQEALPAISTATATPRRLAAITADASRLTTSGENAIFRVDIEKLVADMRGIDGVDRRERIYVLRRYSDCFVGREAVDWMVHRLQVSRTTAVRLGERMAALGFIRHVLDEHDFGDAFLFFRFVTSESDLAAQAKRLPLPDLEDVFIALRSERGIQPTERRRHLIDYKDCFTGRAACDWLRTNYRLSVDSAVGVGSALMLRGEIVHVFDDRPFSNTSELFRFK